MINMYEWAINLCITIMNILTHIMLHVDNLITHAHSHPCSSCITYARICLRALSCSLQANANNLTSRIYVYVSKYSKMIRILHSIDNS